MSEGENYQVEPQDKPLDRDALAIPMFAYLAIIGMDCSKCANRVRNALLSLDGVLLEEVQLEQRIAAVVFDPKGITPADLADAVDGAGNDGRHYYQAEFIKQVPIGGAIGFGLGIPSIVYLIGPALQSNKTKSWTRLGPTSKIELGTPTLFKVLIERQTGWIIESEELSVYVLTEDGREHIAMSNICTHLGCRARWVSDQEQFYCPCHAGVFDKEGYVVSGPPPRPLDRYDVKVEDGQLFIGQLYMVEG